MQFIIFKRPKKSKNQQESWSFPKNWNKRNKMPDVEVKGLFVLDRLMKINN
jgi:hypothetical protein